MREKLLFFFGWGGGKRRWGGGESLTARSPSMHSRLCSDCEFFTLNEAEADNFKAMNATGKLTLGVTSHDVTS